MSEPMHHDHDLDLISALAEGTLSDPGPAEQLVASCGECAEQYRAHLAVQRAVQDEPAPRLAELERARLHTALWNQVGEEIPAPAPSTHRWWYRLAPVAAILVLVVGVGVTNFIGSPEEAATQRAADRTSADTDGAGDDAAAEMAPLADSPGGEDGTRPSSEVTEAADADEEALTEAAGASREELARTAEQFRSQAVGGPPPEEFECEPPAESPPLLAVQGDSVEGESVWLAGFGESERVESVVIYRRADCDIIFTDE